MTGPTPPAPPTPSQTPVELAERLLTTFAIYDRVALAAQSRAPGQWTVDKESWATPGTGLLDANGGGVAVAVDPMVATFLRMFGPPAVLRIIRANRRIVDRHVKSWHFDQVWMCLRCGNLGAPCAEVREIAAAFPFPAPAL